MAHLKTSNVKIAFGVSLKFFERYLNPAMNCLDLPEQYLGLSGHYSAVPEQHLELLEQLLGGSGGLLRASRALLGGSGGLLATSAGLLATSAGLLATSAVLLGGSGPYMSLKTAFLGFTSAYGKTGLLPPILRNKFGMTQKRVQNDARPDTQAYRPTTSPFLLPYTEGSTPYSSLKCLEKYLALL